MMTQNYFPFLVFLLGWFTSYAQINHVEIIGHQQGGFTMPLASDAHFGQAIANLGDLDNDGISDLGIGALYQDSITDIQYERLGTFYINLMKANGTVKQTLNLTDTLFKYIFPTSEELSTTGRHGYTMEGIGDINNDGVPDIALGFPDYETNLQYKDAGGVLILLMEPNGSIKDHNWLDRTQFPSLKRDDRFGHAITALGDINQDGYPEIAISAPRHEVSNQYYGAVWIISLLPNGTVYFSKKVENRFARTSNKYWAFGWALEAVPDVNGDGIAELLVGTPHAMFDLEPVLGNVTMLYLNPSLSYSDFRNINFYENAIGRETVTNDSHFGESIAHLGDIDNDGYPEVAIGGTLDERESEQQGRIWCLSLKRSGDAESLFEIHANQLDKWQSFVPFERLGQQLCGGIDFNNDGRIELLATARKPGGTGTVSVLFGLNEALSASISLENQENIFLFPNPAVSHIFLNEMPEKGSTFRIISASGKIMQVGGIETSIISLSNLPKGTYYFQIILTSGAMTSLPFSKS